MRFPEDVPELTDGLEPRLRLRAHTAADVEPSYEMCVDPEFQRWTTVPVPYERQHAESFVQHKIPAGWRDGGMWAWAIEYQGRFAGTIDLRDGRGDGGEIGFGAAPWARGQGVTTRAARLVLRHAFDSFGWDVVIWRAFVGNWGSRRVAWNTGFREFTTVRGGGTARDVRADEWVATVRAGEDLEPQGRWLSAPVLEDDRLRLRPFREDDAERVAESTSDARTLRWLSHLRQPYEPRHALEWFAEAREAAATGEAVTWAIADPVSDLLLGNISIFELGRSAGNQVGYWMHPDGRGKGLMTAAARLAARYAFTPAEDGGLGCRRLFLRAAAGNEASQHVARSAGFRHIGTERSANAGLDGSFEDLLVFDLLASDPAVVESAG